MVDSNVIETVVQATPLPTQFVGDIVVQSVEVAKGAQPSEGAISALIEMVTRTPMTAVQLVQVSPIVALVVAGMTYVVKRFLLENVEFMVPFGNFAKWVISFFIVMLTAVFWMPIVLPFVLGLMSGG